MYVTKYPRLLVHRVSKTHWDTLIPVFAVSTAVLCLLAGRAIYLLKFCLMVTICGKIVKSTW